MRERIRQFIEKNFYLAEGTAFADDASLLDLGIIDSTGVLELVSFLEESFSIRVEDDELVPANLDSVANMVAYVERKLKAAVSHAAS